MGNRKGQFCDFLYRNTPEVEKKTGPDAEEVTPTLLVKHGGNQG